MKPFSNTGPFKAAGILLALFAGLACHERPAGNKAAPVSPDTMYAHDSAVPLKKDTAAASPLAFLTGLDGKYPSDAHLLKQKKLTMRLQHLLGPERYQFLQENWNVESLCRMSNGVFIAEACMQHNCGATNFIIVADIGRDKLYAGICEEGKVKTYGEDTVRMPQIRSWRTPEPD